MLPDTLSKETIFALRELAKKLRGIFVRRPTQEQLDKDKATIEGILPPDDGYIQELYAEQVSIAYQYARIHYRNTKHSLLSDIKKDPNIVKTIDLSEYKYRLEEDCHCC